MRQDRIKLWHEMIMCMLVTIMIAGASWTAFIATFCENYISGLWIVPVILSGILCGNLTLYLWKQHKVFRFCFLVPIVAALVYGFLYDAMGGCRLWVQIMRYNWNHVTPDPIFLTEFANSKQALIAFMLFAGVLCGEASAWFTSQNKWISYGFFSLFLFLLQLVCDNVNPHADSLMIALLIILTIAGKEFYLTGRSFILCFFIIILFALVSVSDTGEIPSVVQLREWVMEQKEGIRYGEDGLPRGDLSEIGKLHRNKTEEKIEILSEQVKNLYLKAYVGSDYDTEKGGWTRLPHLYYAREYREMIKWMEKKSFHPLNQTAVYYSLCEENSSPDRNLVEIHVKNSSREYLYAPTNVMRPEPDLAQENRDTNFNTKGILGARDYRIAEVSDARPAELLIGEEWLMNPHTQQQRDYLQAESAYREFVYQHYMDVDPDMKKLMNQMFWDDYETDTLGIYSAVTRVREILTGVVLYTDDTMEVPEGEEPLNWYLTKAHRGNAMVYASCAAQALRVYGIPTRYVEGYFVPGGLLQNSEEGAVMLNGSNAHAWIEIYFDGIGWQSVDVTPGYYYTSATLQEMAALSQDVAQNQNSDDSLKETGKILKDNRKTRILEILEQVEVATVFVLGILSIIILIMFVGVILFLMTYLYLERRIRRVYQEADSKGKARIIKKKLYEILSIKKIDAALGWKVEETDKLIAEKFPAVSCGEYARVCELLEKVIYGDLALELYEIRTLEIFLTELTTKEKADSPGVHLPLRQLYKI